MLQPRLTPLMLLRRKHVAFSTISSSSAAFDSMADGHVSLSFRQQRRNHYQYHGPGSSPSVDTLYNSWLDRDFEQRGFTVQQRRNHYRYHGPGSSPSVDTLYNSWLDRDFEQRGFTVGIGGPVGSGKTATVLALCQALTSYQEKNTEDSPFTHLGVVTNDIFTQEDKDYLVKQQALPRDSIRAVETGGCPHAAIREDVSANLAALEDLTLYFQQKQAASPCLLLCESGGDNLAANFSRELADVIIQVIDVAGGDKIPRKGGPGITQSDLLVINKIDLAPAVGADLTLMKQQAQDMRKRKATSSSNKEEGDAEYAPIVMASIKNKEGLEDIVQFILKHYQMAMERSAGAKQN